MVPTAPSRSVQDPTGRVAANVLADAGWSVIVVKAEPDQAANLNASKLSSRMCRSASQLAAPAIVIARSRSNSFEPVEVGDGRLVIQRSAGAMELVGEIDACTAPSLEAALSEDSAPSVTCLDMSDVTFIDSSGLRVLIGHRESLAAVGCKLTIRAPSRSVQRIIEITGLADMFKVPTIC